ncbi:MAG TPA: HAMP domain-containing sensor histidine kinase [Polyangiaceae bacterium]|jgi:signal transduction histidine kinase|nr:HAMP domain-containing sensor histidine kinase [Polyangiaceae bacterium]
MRRRSLLKLAPTLVVALGIAVAALMAFLGFVQLRTHADEAVALRAKVLALTLSERLRAADVTDRTAIVDKAARRSSTELILVEQDGRVVVDGSLGAPGRTAIVELLIAGSGETTTREGRSRFYAAPLGAPVENLSLLVFAPSPELPFATRSLLLSVGVLTAILVGGAALVAFAIARNVNADVAYVRERIVEMALEGAGPSGKSVPVRDTDQVGILTSAFNLLVDRFTAAEHAYQHDLTGALAFDRDRSAFLSALSHELRTPLNAILGFADVLLAEVDGPLSDEARDNLTVLRRSADHLRALIDDILDLSALESGELKLDTSALDVFVIAAEIAREARVTAQDKPLEVLLSGRPAVALADARRVRQILGNLVSNAVKFTREGRVEIHVELDGDYVLMSVSDTGPGIPAEQRAAIFEEYWQAPASRQSRTGAGLGLAITRRLVRMHGGTISVESETGQGSRFTVRLPIRPTESRPVRFISTAPPPPDMVVEPIR